MVHISVQLLSPINLALIMTRQHHLLQTMLAIFKHMVRSGSMHAEIGSGHVIDCSHSLMHDHSYWSVVSDFINLLNHNPIVHFLLENLHLIQYWADIISYFQGMNMNLREMNIHVEYEADLYYTSFTAELEICSTTMWGLLSHLKDESTKHLTINALIAFKEAMSKWFEALHLDSFHTLNPYHSSFHLPLHRYLSILISNAVLKQNISIDYFPINDAGFLKKIMASPLQLFAIFHEIHCGLWVRNGQQIRGQAYTYVQCHFCNSTIDADYFLLQLVASYIDPDYFLNMVFEAFHTLDVLTFQNETAPRRNFLQKSQEIPMLESVLYFLAILFNTRTFSGATTSVGDNAHFRSEMIAMLATSDQTYSHLTDYLPDCIGNHFTDSIENFEGILNQVADFKEPALDNTGTLQQGKYQLKGDLWINEYDPLHVFLRAVYRKDYQSAHDRYTAFLKQHNNSNSIVNYWPPFRLVRPTHPAYSGLFRLLHCRTMHGFIFTILYKIVYLKNLPESITHLVIYLLEMAISSSDSSTNVNTEEIHERYQDREFERWYATDNLFTNINTVIPQIFTTYISTNESKGLSNSTLDVLNESLEWDGRSVREVGILLSTKMYEIGRFNLHASKTDTYSYDAPERTVSEVKEAVPVNESILTLLLKLYSSSCKRNFKTPPLNFTMDSEDSRVGGNELFLSKILTKLCAKSEQCRSMIERINDEASSSQATSSLDDEDSAEERRKKIKLRKQNIMKEFQDKQQRFISESSSQVLEEKDEADVMAEDGDGGLFSCCICNISTLSTVQRPICLISRVMPTSVLGKRSTMQESEFCSDSVEASSIFANRLTFSKDYNFRKELLVEHLFQLNDSSLESGCNSGIHVQTCGHYLHIDCHESYVRSLQIENSLVTQPLLIDRGEFSCPICRQISNVIIPLLSDENFKQSAYPDNNLLTDASIYESIIRVLKENLNTALMDSQLKMSVYEAVKTMSQTWQNILPSKTESILPYSILRTNIELDILSRHISCNLPSRKPCIKTLFKLLSYNGDVKPLIFYWEQWSLLTGITFDDTLKDNTSLQVFNSHCPILMMDMSDNLIHFLLALSSRLSKEYFDCLIRLMYNVEYIQALVLICCKVSSGNLDRLLTCVPADCLPLKEFLVYIYGLLREVRIYGDVEDFDDNEMPAICEDLSTWKKIRQILFCNINPFLKFVSTIKFHIFEEIMPDFSNKSEESLFFELSKYLSLALSEEPEERFSLKWATDDPYGLIRKWTQALYPFSQKHVSATRNIVCRVRTWQRPSLMPLPSSFDQLFQYFRRQRKKDCRPALKNSLLCLLCAGLVCSDKCCYVNSVPQTYTHAIECGAGTVIYIGIETSIIWIIDGTRLAQWGSVYLDKHGEEDRNLKRGKPLFLNKERYQILNKFWISHGLGTFCKNFLLHENSRQLSY